MLGWWRDAGVDLADLAVRRPDGAMAWHHQVPLGELPLAWARAENVRRAEVYVRPSRDRAWPLVFLDDVGVELARGIAAKYDALAIRTSPQAGCHIWLRCDRALDEPGRRNAQQWLARRSGADRASTSGDHLGRLAGLRNWKRAGCWVNVLAASRAGRPWAVRDVQAEGDAPRPPGRGRGAGRDRSPSGRDWARVCHQLEAGADPEVVRATLLSQATARRGRYAAEYARRTVERALAHLGLPE